MKNKSKRFAIISGIILIFPVLSFNQNIPVAGDKRMSGHHEVHDQKYLPYPSGPVRTSAAKTYNGTSIFTTQVNVDGNGQNILGDAANEPSIAVDPSDPDHMVIGWRQFDNVNSNFRQAGYGFSEDAGQSWTFPGKIEAGIFRSDPVLESDTAGNFFYNSLTSDGVGYYCKVFKSIDGGADWDQGADAHGGDKQWMAIDKTGGIGTGNIYSSWNSSFTSCSPGFFTRSTDAGASFEDCIEVDGNPYWGTMTVGTTGELYIAGAGASGGIIVAKSTTAQTPGSFIFWNFSSPVYMDGFLTYQLSVNPAGLLGQASIDVDRSNGPGHGNVYVLASVTRFSNSDPGDVMFAKSTDGGLTWSNPKRINDDPGTNNYQWFGTMSVAPNGRIDVIWLDTRNEWPGSDLSSLYYSWSIDQGETWSANEKLSDSFDPHLGYPQQEKMGDYFDMESDLTSVHLAWANTFNGEQDVYYSHIVPQITGIGDDRKNPGQIALTCFPNPFTDQTAVQYGIASESFVNLAIFNMYGKEITTLVNKNQKAGTYTIYFADGLLPSGFYFCRLSAGTKTETTRLVKIK